MMKTTESKETQREENIGRNIFLKSKFLTWLENGTKSDFTNNTSL